MWWKILQTIVVALVVYSNVQWPWTPNIYLPVICGWVVAFLVTVALGSAINLLGKLRWYCERQRRLG